MNRSTSAMFTAAAILSGIAATPSRADDFCAAVKMIAGQTPLGFAALRVPGEALPGRTGTVGAVYTFPGAVSEDEDSACKIYNEALEDGHAYVYLCHLPAAAASVAAVAGHMAACVGQPTPQPVVRRGGRISYALLVNGVEYRVNSTPDLPGTILLSIGEHVPEWDAR
jgi:hypothetical protein